MKDFDIFYNALSVGWHLKRIMELSPELMDDDEKWERFILWLERHKVKKQELKDLTDK